MLFCHREITISKPMTKTMIMVAPNGARRTKNDHPALPITPDELAQEAVACFAAGASAMHMHVRDDNQGHTLDARKYLDASAAVRTATSAAGAADMILQITTEAVGIYQPQEQMACVRAVRPQAVSVALKEIVPDDDDIASAQAFFQWLQTAQIAPQFILYDPHDVERFLSLQGRGVIPFTTPFVLFVLGRYAKDQQSDPQDLDPFLAAMGHHRLHWAMCAFGRREAECAVYAAKNGGHVRIGFENNLLLPSGETAPSNSALVAATRTLLEAAGRQVMHPQEAAGLLTQTLR